MRSPRTRPVRPEPAIVRPEHAREHVAALLAAPVVRRRDRAIDYAPAIATSVEPILHGRHYFARMLDDIAAATDHVHLLIYRFTPGAIGTLFREALEARVRDGIEVRLVVDAIGSEVDLRSRTFFRRLARAGVQVVAHDGLFVLRHPVVGERRPRLRLREVGHFDHRKMLVVDGRIGYVGGSGIEDHFTDDRWTDVMCRVTGPIVAQLQHVFLATWRKEAGPEPAGADDRVERWFPPFTIGDPADPADWVDPADPVAPFAAPTGVPTTVLCNVPGSGHHPISTALIASLSGATDRIDIANPYISNRAILASLLGAARRGVPVRIIAPGRPTPRYPAAVFRHHFRRLLDAGAEIRLHPEMVHAKVIRVDERVFLGSCNLDDLSLYRNDELDLLFDDAGAPALVERTIFAELAAMSVPASAATALRQRVWDASMDRVSRLL